MNKQIILPLVALLLTGCTVNNDSSQSSSFDDTTSSSNTSSQPQVIENYMKAISPSGAPAIAFYDQGNSGTFETNQTPSNVLAQLSQDNYGMVVFDFYNGLKNLKANQGHYKLAKIITAGNLYLVGIDKTNQPTAEDKIVSFGQGLIPDLAFNYLYKDNQEILNNVSYVASTSEAGAILTAGMYEGEAVDYVVVAQPVLSTVLANTNANTYGRLNVIASFKDMWKEKTGQDGIPQAGLFINMNYYEEHQNYFDEQLELISTRLDTCINDPLSMKQTMDEQLSLQEQAALFGFNSQIAYNVQSSQETPNGFALLGSQDNIDINDFFLTLGIDEDYLDYIL